MQRASRRGVDAARAGPAVQDAVRGADHGVDHRKGNRQGVRPADGRGGVREPPAAWACRCRPIPTVIYGMGDSYTGPSAQARPANRHSLQYLYADGPAANADLAARSRVAAGGDEPGTNHARCISCRAATAAAFFLTRSAITTRPSTNIFEGNDGAGQIHHVRRHRRSGQDHPSRVVSRAPRSSTSRRAAARSS